MARRRSVPPLTARSEAILATYLCFLVTHRGIARTSLRSWDLRLREFLWFLQRRRIRSLRHLRPKFLSEYLVAKNRYQPHTLAGIASKLRRFLQYLCMSGVVAQDLSPHVPRIRIWRQDRVPSVWSAEQVEAMLAAIDRTAPLGKRNYAILLLVCRLGLRACDVKGLRLEDIRWDEAKISIRQRKTGVPLVLPLPEEVRQALIDYLIHARPVSTNREVFLVSKAPFRPFGDGCSFWGTIAAYRRRAGIKATREGHWGMHSLRHSLATRLLEVGTPLPVIADILGHRSMRSTQIYAKVDLPSLRDTAVDPEEVLRG